MPTCQWSLSLFPMVDWKEPLLSHRYSLYIDIFTSVGFRGSYQSGDLHFQDLCCQYVILLGSSANLWWLNKETSAHPLQSYMQAHKAPFRVQKVDLNKTQLMLLFSSDPAPPALRSSISHSSFKVSCANPLAPFDPWHGAHTFSLLPSSFVLLGAGVCVANLGGAGNV